METLPTDVQFRGVGLLISWMVTAGGTDFRGVEIARGGYRLIDVLTGAPTREESRGLIIIRTGQGAVQAQYHTDSSITFHAP